jgi:hypothetical protein
MTRRSNSKASQRKHGLNGTAKHTSQISEDISKRRTSYANALPPLRTLAIKTKFKGAKQNGPKGTWKYAQDVHDAANARRTPTPAGKNKLETEKPGRGSPNLLASSQVSKKETKAYHDREALLM